MKAIINLDKVKYPDVVTAKNGAAVLENGAFVGLKGLVTGDLNRDCYEIEQLASTTVAWGYVADVAVMYDETKDERDFEVAANAITRVYRPRKGDCITIATKHVDGTVNAGDALELKATSYQLQKKSTGAAVARVLEKYTFEGQESLYIEFV